ncbi:MAG: hypothetical protein GTO18_06325 [Anaerolineales bacterium]|nr:hypothetical protein [Anaerolineales bacterium]
MVCAILLSAYTLTYSGALRVDDEHILAARAQSYAFWNKFSYPQVYGNERVRNLSTVEEPIADPIVAIEPGQTLLGAFFFKLASLVNVGGVQAFSTIALFATALTGLVVYATTLVLGHNTRTAIFTALLYGLCTMAWPFAKTSFRDPLAALFVAITFLGWAILITSKESKWILALGLIMIGVFGGLMIKSITLVVILAFLLTSIILIFLRRNRAVIRRSIIAAFIPLALILILAFTLPRLGLMSRFSISHYLELATRYLNSIDKATWIAAVGPFLSPTKNLFLFSPILVMVPYVVVTFWKRLASFAIPALLTVILFAIAQALHLKELWAGSMYWGLRFMLPALPIMAIILAPFVEKFFESGWKWLSGLFVGLISLSFLVQIAGALVSWHIPFKVWLEQGKNPYLPNVVWDLGFQSIPIHLSRIFNTNSWDVGWVRTMGTDSSTIFIPGLISIVFMCLFLLLFTDVGDRLGRTFALFGTVLLTTVAVLMPLFLSLRFLDLDPKYGGDREEIVTAINWVEDHVEKDDIVVVDSYGTTLWHAMMNEWDVPVPWYSLPFEIPGTVGVGISEAVEPSQATIDVFQIMSSQKVRLFYLTTSDTPDYGLEREHTWLSNHLSRVDYRYFNGLSLVEVSVFSLGESNSKATSLSGQVPFQ